MGEKQSWQDEYHQCPTSDTTVVAVAPTLEQCSICGNKVAHLENHHIIPREYGGQDLETVNLCSFVTGGYIIKPQLFMPQTKRVGQLVPECTLICTLGKMLPSMSQLSSKPGITLRHLIVRQSEIDD